MIKLEFSRDDIEGTYEDGKFTFARGGSRNDERYFRMVIDIIGNVAPSHGTNTGHFSLWLEEEGYKVRIVREPEEPQIEFGKILPPIDLDEIQY